MHITTFTIIFFLLLSVAAAYSIGDIRLSGSTIDREGRVEVLYNIQNVSGNPVFSWGTVCHRSWDTADATVVCRQLGYHTYGATAYTSAYFGQGTGEVYMKNVRCDGHESRLIDCRHGTNFTNCGHNKDVGVRCNPASCADGDIQLVDGVRQWKGRLEICFNQRWGTVSGEGWDSTDTEVVCRELGYQGGLNYTSASGTGPVFMSSVCCSGSETRLLDCGYAIPLSAYNHSTDISVTCSPVPCADGDIQLVGGETERKGRVEVCLDQRWGTVNGDGWSSVDAQVVCRQLGYPTTSEDPLTSFSDGTGPILVDNVGCFGWETRLIDCGHNRDTSEDTHDEDVAIHCLPALPPAPQSISSQSLSSTTLRVKWTLLTPVTAEYGTILEYVITCSAQEDLFFETVRRNTSQSTMTGLEPSTTYNCCVSAENIAGNGMAVCGEGTTLNESTSSGISNSRLMAILTPLILFVICIIIGIICIFGCMYYRRNNRRGWDPLPRDQPQGQPYQHNQQGHNG